MYLSLCSSIPLFFQSFLSPGQRDAAISLPLWGGAHLSVAGAEDQTSPIVSLPPDPLPWRRLRGPNLQVPWGEMALSNLSFVDSDWKNYLIYFNLQEIWIQKDYLRILSYIFLIIITEQWVNVQETGLLYITWHLCIKILHRHHETPGSDVVLPGFEPQRSSGWDHPLISSVLCSD